MKIFCTTAIVIVLLTAINAQDNTSKTHQKNITEAVYFQDFVNYASDKDGLSRVDIYVQVPYKNVRFIKSPQGFTAKYSITASVFDSSGSKLIVEKTWNETINVMDYNLTTSKENYNLSKRAFDLSEGIYKIRTLLTDKDSRQEAVGENIFTVKNYDKNISMSDLLLISKADNKSNIIPNVSRNYPSSKNRIQVYFEVYLVDSAENNVSINYSVLNSENQSIHNESENRNIKQGTNQVLFSLQEFPFDLGVYNLKVSIVDSAGIEITNTLKSFYSHWRGLPSVIKDIDKAIAQTVYIASPEELSYMNDGENIQDKTKRFLEFWKKKDPSPNNDENEIFDEYFRRVIFSNENFSNYTEGWRSDRGMVYTILGPPNNIDRHPFEYDSKPYEVWEYYDLNRSFVFVDQTGFGDYRLVTPLSGDLYRYRY
jgi:GWxTD domain-containing protein